MKDRVTEGIEDPIQERQRMRELLSQETRHLILQLILGHPAHLVSVAEFEYMIPKNKAAILDHLEKLQAAGILEVYVHEPNASTRDLPSKFWGPSSTTTNSYAAFRLRVLSTKRRGSQSVCCVTKMRHDQRFPSQSLKPLISTNRR
jgi:hypothetical protein